jgi:hypothetical protein
MASRGKWDASGRASGPQSATEFFEQVGVAIAVSFCFCGGANLEPPLHALPGSRRVFAFSRLCHHFYQNVPGFCRTVHLAQESDAGSTRPLVGLQAYVKA